MPRRSKPGAFLFDLDGTLIDSVYVHVLAWHEALETMKWPLPAWRIHHRIGMSDDLIAHALAREIGRPTNSDEEQELRRLHTEAFLKRVDQIRVLPGATDILAFLTQQKVAWTIATSSNRERARHSLALLGVGEEIPVVTREQVAFGKPDPAIFIAAAERLGVEIEDCVVVGDSIWDLLAGRRARALSIGVLTGGYAREELLQAGSYRVYEDVGDLLRHLDEVGVRALS